MSEERIFKPKITKINHICMVVKDMDAAIKRYEDVYGIGPWIMGGEEDFKYLEGTTYVHGKQVDFKGRLALCSALNIELELIQPLDENSHYAEFLREHGEGMHHLMVDIDDKAEYIETVEGRGNEILFQGYVSVPPFTEKIMCTYHDARKDLGFICEIAPDPSEPI
jgi:methylmalonyl-CoA/ethylmalonyl-CoA epimerase